MTEDVMFSIARVFVRIQRVTCCSRLAQNGPQTELKVAFLVMCSSFNQNRGTWEMCEKPAGQLTFIIMRHCVEAIFFNIGASFSNIDLDSFLTCCQGHHV